MKKVSGGGPPTCVIIVLSVSCFTWLQSKFVICCYLIDFGNPFLLSFASKEGSRPCLPTLLCECFYSRASHITMYCHVVFKVVCQPNHFHPSQLWVQFFASSIVGEDCSFDLLQHPFLPFSKYFWRFIFLQMLNGFYLMLHMHLYLCWVVL
jgi:hypothetical protein